MWNTAWMKMKPALRIKNWQGWRYKRRSKTVKANVSDNCTLQKNKNKKIIKKKIKIIWPKPFTFVWTIFHLVLLLSIRVGEKKAGVLSDGIQFTYLNTKRWPTPNDIKKSFALANFYSVFVLLAQHNIHLICYQYLIKLMICCMYRVSLLLILN